MTSLDADFVFFYVNRNYFYHTVGMDRDGQAKKKKGKSLVYKNAWFPVDKTTHCRWRCQSLQVGLPNTAGGDAGRCRWR